MNPFSLTSKCVKCGGNATAKYRRKMISDDGHVANLDPTSADRIVRTCSICAYIWYEAPLDKENVRGQNPTKMPYIDPDQDPHEGTVVCRYEYDHDTKETKFYPLDQASSSEGEEDRGKFIKVGADHSPEPLSCEICGVDITDFIEVIFENERVLICGNESCEAEVMSGVKGCEYCYKQKLNRGTNLGLYIETNPAALRVEYLDRPVLESFEASYCYNCGTKLERE